MVRPFCDVLHLENYSLRSQFFSGTKWTIDRAVFATDVHKCSHVGHYFTFSKHTFKAKDYRRGGVSLPTSYRHLIQWARNSATLNAILKLQIGHVPQSRVKSPRVEIRPTATPTAAPVCLLNLDLSHDVFTIRSFGRWMQKRHGAWRHTIRLPMWRSYRVHACGPAEGRSILRSCVGLSAVTGTCLVGSCKWHLKQWYPWKRNGQRCSECCTTNPPPTHCPCSRQPQLLNTNHSDRRRHDNSDK